MGTKVLVYRKCHWSNTPFYPLLGEPSQIIGPFVLWSNLPFIDVGYNFEHSKYDDDPGSHNPFVLTIGLRYHLS